MRKVRMKPISVFLITSVYVPFLVLSGCSGDDPVEHYDPPIINDLDIWYVNASSGGVRDGSSWENAFTSIQEAVDYAGDGDMVWVAAGTYGSPVPGDSSTPVIRMKANVDIYGGFSVSGTGLGDRDPAANPTVLDGRNRARHVVTGADQARLDGFIVRSGYAYGGYPDNCGGGMLNYRVSPEVENCIFTSNDAGFHGAGMANIHSAALVRNCTFRLNLAVNNGAGVYNDDENGIDGRPVFEGCVFGPQNSCRFGGGMYNNRCETTITDCVFIDNFANHNGGGLYNTSSRVTARSCVFTENRAYAGGAVYMNGIAAKDSTRLENCLIKDNTAYVQGGGVYLYRSSSSLTNCTITRNAANYGGGVSCWLSGAELVNCVVWANVAYNMYAEIEIGSETLPRISHCDIDQEGYGAEEGGEPDAGGNMRKDPLFAAGPDGDCYLSCAAAGQESDSPCLDAGISTLISAWLNGYTTTRTDGVPDTAPDDIGYHYSP